MQASELKTRIDLKNILFATDFSPAAAAALPYVAAIAKLYGSRVCAVHVKTRESDWTPDEEIERLEDSLRTVPHEFLVETGDVRTVLLRPRSAKQSDLLISAPTGAPDWPLSRRLAGRVSFSRSALPSPDSRPPSHRPIRSGP